MNTQTSKPIKHTLATRILHHLSVVMIVALWILIEFEYYDWHKGLGAVFLFWVLLRLVNLVIRPKMPKLAAPPWQTGMAHLVHTGLYAVMLAMPISGILMSVYGGRPVSVFGLFNIPVFVTPSREMASFYNNLHTDVIFPALIALVVAHVLAALYHQFIKKDNLLARMR
ncbi:MAG: cytochrome b [Moraxella sp.]|nr:cytochrome b [Moraxella sp.]